MEYRVTEELQFRDDDILFQAKQLEEYKSYFINLSNNDKTFFIWYVGENCIPFVEFIACNGQEFVQRKTMLSDNIQFSDEEYEYAMGFIGA